jgi:hypothetical protein
MLAPILFLACWLSVVAIVFLLWRKRFRHQHDLTPAEQYRREIAGLRGGGIHPGGQSAQPPKPDNAGGSYC